MPSSISIDIYVSLLNPKKRHLNTKIIPLACLYGRVGFFPEESSFFPSGRKKLFFLNETGRNWKKLEEMEDMGESG